MASDERGGPAPEVSPEVSRMKESIKASMLLIGEPGRREILRVLTESSNPWQSLSQLQDQWSLGYDRCRPALQFLDALSQSRSLLYVQVFEHMKTKLDQQLDCIKDEEGLKQMLNETIHFLSIRDLKSIPVSIIKRLKQVPDRYLLHLAKKKLLNELPLPIRRQAWELSHPLFAAAIEGPCRECIALAQTPGGVNRTDLGNPVKVLVEYVGQSETLFSVLANFCALKCREEKQPHWGGVIRHVLMGLQDDGQRIQSLGKLEEMAWQFDQSRRSGKLDILSFLKVVEILKQLIISQATSEERNYRRLLDDVAAGNGRAVQQYRKKDAKSRLGDTRLGKSLGIAAPKRRSDPSAPLFSSDNNPHGPRSTLPRGPVIAPQVLKAALEEAWAFMNSIDVSKLFAEPVSDEQAKGYSSRIKKPVDLQTMKLHMLQGRFLSLEEFDDNVLRMFRNCRDYNGEHSEYTAYARKLNKQWKPKIAELKLRLMGDPEGKGHSQILGPAASDRGVGGVGLKNPASSSMDVADDDNDARDTAPPSEQQLAILVPEPVPVPSGPVRPFPFAAAAESIKEYAPQSREALRAILDQGWEYLRDLDSFGLFANPVTDLVAKDYSKIVTEPMDLSLLRLRLNRKYKSLADFGADVELMVNNCFKYNGYEDTSEPVVYAKLLRDAWAYLSPTLESVLSGSFDPQSQVPEPPVLTAVALSAHAASTYSGWAPQRVVGLSEAHGGGGGGGGSCRPRFSGCLIARRVCSLWRFN